MPSADHEGPSVPLPRRLGDYEILAELARGGMGVVFKARHVKLDRLVALKMILAGQLASPSDVQRFYVEAEAAAKLDHPGIVPIYDIGQQNGQHYFAMKLVEGGDLYDRMQELRRDPHVAAELVSKVARAVHHAHARGILHRDLKPSNILLDEHGEPVITDFGLAKRIEGHSNLTQTGAVLGTPAYMPPEQASGQEVTTAADIYSLGAILYEVLTGRPLYQGDSPLKTMLQVLAGPPQSPREINPKLDRDLELICLKCLARDPVQRYATAGAVADDLDNYQAGRPLSIRPPAMATVFRAWFRENVRAVAWTGVIGVVFGLLIGLAIYVGQIAGSITRMAGVYDRLPNVQRPLLAIDWSVPDWLAGGALMALLVLMVYLGLVTAAVVRPTSRQAALAAGMGVGLLTAVTSFTVSIAWGPIFGATVENNRYDLDLLAQAAFHEGAAGESQPADRLLYRYPDLQEIPASQRGQVLSGKLRTDMSSGVMLGVWLAMLAALGIGLGPGVGGTLGAYAVLRERGLLRRAIVPYTEAATVATIAGGSILFYWFAPFWLGIHPPFWLFLIVLTVLGFAFYGIVVRQWRLRWRLPLHAAWIGAVALLAWHESGVAQLPIALAGQIRAEQLQEASATLDRMLQRNPGDDFSRYQAAILQLHLGNEERYQEHCRILLDHSRHTDNPATAERAAKACLVTSGGLEQRQEAFERAERSLKLGGGHPHLYWFELAAGMSACRQQQWQDALDLLDRCLSKTRGDLSCSSIAHAFRAMALASLGRRGEAQAALSQADAHHARLKKRSAGNWHDMLIFEIARKEAATMLGSQ